MADLPPEVQQMLVQALLGRDNRGGMQQELAAYDQMGPQGFAAHSNLGTMEDRRALAAQDSKAQQDMVAQQLAQAQKFGEPQNRNYGTVAGNILGGVGDLARQVGGAIRSNKLGQQQADIAKQGMAAQASMLDKMDATRAQSGTAQMEAIRKIQEALMARQNGAMPGQQSGAGFGLPDLQFNPYGG